MRNSKLPLWLWRRISLLAVFVACYSLLMAQSQKITGTVTDATGKPLVGASVLVKGTTTGTSTDDNGKFVLSVNKASVVLQVSMTGFALTTVTAEAGKSVAVQLTENPQEMEEVVVVGYGKQKRTNVVGSVAQINGDELKKMPAMNVTNMLAGRLPGLTTLQQSGRPGADDAALRIRGTGTYGANQGPLVIIDNVERPSFANLDPNEIESITILKDAVSTAVYGLQAANGIILITTKRGKNQKPVVSYDGAVTVNSNTRFPKFLNGPDYMTWYNKGIDMDNDYQAHVDGDPVPYVYTQKQIDDVRNGTNTNPFLGNTDWVGMLADNTATSQQHGVTVRGGTDKVKYFSSIGFLDQQGVVKNTDFKRYNVRTNVDAQVNDYLSVALDLGLRQQLSNTPGIAPDNTSYMNPFYQAVRMLPNMPMYAPNGLPIAHRAGAGWVNPIAAIEKSGYQKGQTNVFQGNISFNFKVPGVKGLEAKVLAAYDKSSTENKGWLTPYEMMGRERDQVTGNFTRVPNPPAINRTTLRQSYSQNNRRTFQPSISYNNKFGDHNVTGLLLYEWSSYKSNLFSTGASNFPLTDLQEINFGSTATADWITPTGSSSVNARAGLVARFNYAYKDRYLLEIANRWDASVKFAKNNRWRTFPALGLGWVISKENFFADLNKTVSFFKLKGSVGRLGNDVTQAFGYMQTFQLTSDPVVVMGGQPIAALYTSNPPYPNIRWESATSTNIGFESILWNGGLSIDFEWFDKITDDILSPVGNRYPLSIGGYYPTSVNYGKMANHGFDLQLRHNNRLGALQVGLTGNLNWSRNKLLRYDESPGLPAHLRTVGRPYGQKVGFVVEGMYQDWDEAYKGISPSGGFVAPGFFKYKDLNGDGRLTRTDDMTFVGRSNIPELMFGFTIDLKYKGFDFSALLQGAALCNVSLAGLYEGSSNVSGVEDNTPFTRPFYNFGNSPYYLVENAWTPENPNAEFPRLSSYKAPLTAHNANANSGWIRDGSYLRLKSMQIGYTLPAKWLQAAKIQQLRVYVSGFNLFTWDKLKFLDPEMPNVNNGFYPQQRMISGGMNITF